MSISITWGVSTPSQSQASRSGEGGENGIVQIGFEGTEVARPHVPDSPDFAIKPTVEDVEILRPSEDFRLSDAATVPSLTATFEDRISGVFRNGHAIIDQRGRMTDGRRPRRLPGADDVYGVIHDGNGGMGRALSPVFGVSGNHGSLANARPLAEIAVTHQ